MLGRFLFEDLSLVVFGLWTRMARPRLPKHSYKHVFPATPDYTNARGPEAASNSSSHSQEKINGNPNPKLQPKERSQTLTSTKNPIHPHPLTTTHKCRNISSYPKIKNIQSCPNWANNLSKRPSITFPTSRASVTSPQSQLHPCSFGMLSHQGPIPRRPRRKEPQSEWRGLSHQNTALYEHVFPAILCCKGQRLHLTHSNPSSNSNEIYRI